MEEKNFWNLIETTWINSGRNEERLKAIKSNGEDVLDELSKFIEAGLINFYRAELEKLGQDELTSYIHILEEKLYQIDRQEIHEYTDGSDDGFLYCRCFIVAMGKEYYEKVDKDPSKASFYLDAESFGFEAYMFYENKFSNEFDRNSIHCIESCSNHKGWKM